MTPELTTAFSGLVLAALGAATLIVSTLGVLAVGHLKKLGANRDKQLELQAAELELKRVEIEDKLKARVRLAAADVAAIVEEQARAAPGGHLTGAVKQELAAEKLRELEPSARELEGSKLTDLVRLGVAQMRASLPSTYTLTSSMPPPPAPREEAPTLPPVRRAPPKLPKEPG